MITNVSIIVQHFFLLTLSYIILDCLVFSLLCLPFYAVQILAKGKVSYYIRAAQS